ncbi:uncharacterized protein LOC118598300 [Oryzias melastigma]|uniref:uncharacterized protein LOC118598300 n=1 Tax=Oryzias melastigma TaxID=30732 RepID=UPI00168D052B|nr:uncharacterized protein LOC118598300 [Oryzias melastigma]
MKKFLGKLRNLFGKQTNKVTPLETSEQKPKASNKDVSLDFAVSDRSRHSLRPVRVAWDDVQAGSSTGAQSHAGLSKDLPVAATDQSSEEAAESENGSLKMSTWDLESKESLITVDLEWSLSSTFSDSEESECSDYISKIMRETKEMTKSHGYNTNREEILAMIENIFARDFTPEDQWSIEEERIPLPWGSVNFRVVFEMWEVYHSIFISDIVFYFDGIRCMFRNELMSINSDIQHVPLSRLKKKLKEFRWSQLNKERIRRLIEENYGKIKSYLPRFTNFQFKDLYLEIFKMFISSIHEDLMKDVCGFDPQSPDEIDAAFEFLSESELGSSGEIQSETISQTERFLGETVESILKDAFLEIFHSQINSITSAITDAINEVLCSESIGLHETKKQSYDKTTETALIKAFQKIKKGSSRPVTIRRVAHCIRKFHSSLSTGVSFWITFAACKLQTISKQETLRQVYKEALLKIIHYHPGMSRKRILKRIQRCLYPEIESEQTEKRARKKIIQNKSWFKSKKSSEKNKKIRTNLQLRQSVQKVITLVVQKLLKDSDCVERIYRRILEANADENMLNDLNIHYKRVFKELCEEWTRSESMPSMTDVGSDQLNEGIAAHFIKYIKKSQKKPRSMKSFSKKTENHLHTQPKRKWWRVVKNFFKRKFGSSAENSKESGQIRTEENVRECVQKVIVLLFQKILKDSNNVKIICRRILNANADEIVLINLDTIHKDVFKNLCEEWTRSKNISSMTAIGRNQLNKMVPASFFECIEKSQKKSCFINPLPPRFCGFLVGAL